MKLLQGMLFLVLATFIPLAASAQSVTFTNNDGTFTFTNSTNVLDLGVTDGGGISGLPSPGKLTAISGLDNFGITSTAVAFNPVTNTCVGPCLGTITLSTAAAPLISGSITTSAVFQPGGTFMVSYSSGVTFSGSFSSATWDKSPTLPNTWIFTGDVMNGTLFIPGAAGGTFTNINAGTVQLTTVGAAPVPHPTKGTTTFSDNQGTTNFPSPAPEPGTLTLFGSGLIAVGVLARRKLSGRVPTL
jgi:hypothetical protein